MMLALGLPGGQEMLVILVLVVLLFGAKRVPELARALGRSLSEFKKGREEGLRDVPRPDAEVRPRENDPRTPPPPQA